MDRSGKCIPFWSQNWAVVSAKHPIRKACPVLSLNSGMHFPLKLLPENASHSERSFRDTASACGPVGKVHPALRARSEMQFPLEARSGNGIPLWGRNLGHSFRLRAGSGKRVPFRAAIPGHSFRRYKATVRCPYHMPSNMRSRNTKQQIECSFSKSTRPETYQDFISSYRSRSPITAHRFKQEICRQKQVIYLHG